MADDTPVAAAVSELGERFWRWRARQQPRSSDDIGRLERPRGWVPDWSPEAVQDYRRQLAAMDAEWRAIDVADDPVAVQVDARLVGSALARVRWELDLLRSWQRDPTFYVDQTLGTVFDVLVVQPPLDADRMETLVDLLATVPSTLAHARTNLTDAAAPFARVAMDNLADVQVQLGTALAALPDDLPLVDRVRDAGDLAGEALNDYRAWLGDHVASMHDRTAVGRDAYRFFLRDVALLPYTPEELLAMGRQEWHRAVALEAVARNRHRDAPTAAVFASVDEQIAAAHDAELAVREFYEQQGLLSQPAALGHYRNLALPAYLEPLSWLGVTDDLTSPTRLDQDGISYLPPPAEDLPYFDLANARDPRAGIVHEGVHYQQLARSFAHLNPLRRHFYDSTPNEGIAFYNEELMLRAGLFDDRPDTQLAIHSFMRLRALRVEVDVRLALGDIDIAGATSYLENAVPMDADTARHEAAFFASTPGQAPSYQIGKLQIQRLLSDAVRLRGGRRSTSEATAGTPAGSEFSLRAFHDDLWLDGNVPLALWRWEHLGLRDDLDALDARPHGV